MSLVLIPFSYCLEAILGHFKAVFLCFLVWLFRMKNKVFLLNISSWYICRNDAFSFVKSFIYLHFPQTHVQKNL